MPDSTEGHAIPDPSTTPPADDAPATEGASLGGRVHIETAYARGAGSSADVDGTHHHAAAPGEGEGTGIGESGG